MLAPEVFPGTGYQDETRRIPVLVDATVVGAYGQHEDSSREDECTQVSTDHTANFLDRARNDKINARPINIKYALDRYDSSESVLPLRAWSPNHVSTVQLPWMQGKIHGWVCKLVKQAVCKIVTVNDTLGVQIPPHPLW